jgi:hypothetical protein
MISPTATTTAATEMPAMTASDSWARKETIEGVGDDTSDSSDSLDGPAISVSDRFETYEVYKAVPS